jgi:beta-N-acetylhexosaminidase
MDDMVGIAKALPTMRADTAVRLDLALAGTADFSSPVEIAAQAALIETRDRLLALVARA